MALYEVKDPFVLPEPMEGKDIDQQYVWDCLPINKYQREALYEFLVHQKEIDYALLTEQSNRPLIPDEVKAELEDVTDEYDQGTNGGEFISEQLTSQPSSTSHPDTSLASLDAPDRCCLTDAESEQKPL
jgi:hypothetical protein